MDPHPPPGQQSLGHYGFFKRPRTEEDGPLLRARTRFNPDVEVDNEWSVCCCALVYACQKKVPKNPSAS